jgi:hypothetical protein
VRPVRGQAASRGSSDLSSNESTERTLNATIARPDRVARSCLSCPTNSGRTGALRPILDSRQTRRLSAGFHKGGLRPSPQATRSALGGFRATPDNRETRLSHSEKGITGVQLGAPARGASSQSAAWGARHAVERSRAALISKYGSIRQCGSEAAVTMSCPEQDDARFRSSAAGQGWSPKRASARVSGTPSISRLVIVAARAPRVPFDGSVSAMANTVP